MIYELNGKKHRIPDTAIEQYIKNLQVTKAEAIQIWLEDEGILENEEQQQLCQKAKENKVTKLIQAKNIEKQKTTKKRDLPPDTIKMQIIENLFCCINAFADNVVIENKTKIITFEFNNQHFKIDLIRKRDKKNG